MSSNALRDTPAALRILAFDTATSVAAMAVVADGTTLAEDAGFVRASHGESLLPELAALLVRAELPLAAIDLFAVGIGPGSFTGTRIGVATAKGLAWAEQKPVIGVSTLRVLARGMVGSSGSEGGPNQDAAERAPRVVLTDAYKNEVYAALYLPEPDGTLTEGLAPFHAPPEQAAQRLLEALAEQPNFWLAGGGFDRYADALAPLLGHGGARRAPPAADVPRGSCLAREAQLAFAQEGPSSLAALEPLYVRPSDAKLPASATPKA